MCPSRELQAELPQTSAIVLHARTGKTHIMTSGRSNDPVSLPLTRPSLRPDCGNCFALCCTALGFTRSADFPIDKEPGSPCHNLATDFSRSIHASLRPRGFRGCTVFDCFGAGQNVSQGLFGGRSWRDDPDSREEMFAAFAAARQLHELLWYLAEAQERAFDLDAAQQAASLRGTIEQLVRGELEGLLAADLAELHARVRSVLIEVSEEVRASFGAADEDPDEELRPRADLIGRDLRSRRLCAADLRGASLIATDLRGGDLTATDLLGADLRDARLDGADLSTALYLTQMQVNAARGDQATRLPVDLDAPSHWLLA